MTPNQLVAYNLRRARYRREWTQEEAAERLEPFLGERWSKATFSVAERSAENGRRRSFSANDIFAFARAFELPVSFFFTPAPWTEEVAPEGASETTDREQTFETCFALPETAQDVLIGDVLEFSAPTTRLLNRWRDEYAAAAAKRDADVKERFGEFREFLDEDEGTS